MKNVIRLIFAVTFLVIIMVTLLPYANAQWSAIKSGYAITTDWHGEDVPAGTPVTAWAGTTNETVYQIRFLWLDPNGTIRYDITITKDDMVNYTTPDYPPAAPEDIIEWAQKNHNITIWYANNAQTPDSVGDWAVKAWFYSPEGHLMNSTVTKIRATSFNTVPYTPIGTIITAVTMIAALTTFITRKRKIPHIF